MTRDPDPAAPLARAAAGLDQALMAQDAVKAASYFTESAILGESGLDDVVGRAAIEAFLAEANTRRRVEFHRLVREELIPLGDRAIELARFDEIKRRPGADPVRERGRTVTFWRREADGEWRIERLVVSDLPAPDQPTDAEARER